MNNSIEVIGRLKSIHNATTDKQLSEIFGLSKTGVFHWKNRDVIPYKEVCMTALEKGISLEWLLTGKGDKMETGSTAQQLTIPHYAIQASAGGGALVEAEPIEQHLSLSREWLKREGISSKDLIGIYAKGDSMEPTINSGDSLLIDREKNIVGSEGGIYVINFEGELFVKRVQKLLDGRVAVTSDNKNHLSIEISKHDLERLKIIGRVVWFGRKL
ncbi:LexA family transcriptional regulator [Marinomonas foliarum]|uniref:Phage repressor protein C with HTH and peptisase S24 domain n=1 Tax=Marinomonas foliarum TaxID=491950 RepID=A0A369AFH8_9GAMM|nr:S24 family peptidase [Marinomonas foliarum]RCX07036.1 phage repressor protein C with HTH and peptisase S24 domain [Marinomonas foliarum]